MVLRGKLTKSRPFYSASSGQKMFFFFLSFFLHQLFCPQTLWYPFNEFIWKTTALYFFYEKIIPWYSTYIKGLIWWIMNRGLMSPVSRLPYLYMCPSLHGYWERQSIKGRSLKGTSWIILLLNGLIKWSKINVMFVQHNKLKYGLVLFRSPL